MIEDIHWADPALLDLLEHLADRVVGPVLFLCPVPAGAHGAPPRMGRRPPQRLLPRDRAAVRRATPTSSSACCSRSRICPTASASQILERAEGNPFFLEEIVRHLIDDGRIVRAGDRWRAAPDIGDVEIPDTVQGVLAARIDLLDAAEKRALQRGRGRRPRVLAGAGPAAR